VKRTALISAVLILCAGLFLPGQMNVSAPSPVNVSQFGGTAIATGTGASGSGVPRVTVSNDSTHPVSQSGTWTMQLSGSSNAQVAATAATVVKATSGTVRRLIVGTGVASATVKVFDLASASCTGSPSSAKLTLTLPSTLNNPFTVEVNSSFANGICVQDSSASLLLTVVYD